MRLRAVVGAALGSWLGAAFVLAASAAAGAAPPVAFSDPAGDDVGAGALDYPTHPVFRAGVFDLREMTVAKVGRDVVFTLTFNAPVGDVWHSARWGGPGFSLQHVQIYVDTGAATSTQGHAAGLPGSGVHFDPTSGRWDRVVVIHPERSSVITRGLVKGRDVRASFGKRAVVLPRRVSVAGATMTVTVRGRSLARRVSPDSWGYQALVGGGALGSPLSSGGWRGVGEQPSPWRFASAAPCTPPVVDMLGPTQGSGLVPACGPQDSVPTVALVRPGPL